MDGSDISTLEIWSAGHRDIDTTAHTDNGPLKKTLAAWQALGTYKQRYGILPSWDVNPADLWATNQFVIDPASANAHGLEGSGILNPAYRITGSGPQDPDNGDPANVHCFDGYYEDTGLLFNAEKVYCNGTTWMWFDGDHWLLGRALGGKHHYEQIDADCSTPEGSLWMGGEFPDPDSYGNRTYIVDEDMLGPLVALWTGGEVTLDEWTLSFQHDLLIEIDGWPLGAVDRQVSPYVNDIATIEHLTSVNVYDATTKPIDWTTTDATTPDPTTGSFSVTAPGGTVTMALRSNFLARQAAVPGGAGAIAVPTAYQYWKADSLYGTGNPVEAHEAVYCWRGWGYLYQGFTVPDVDPLSKLTCTINYRSGLTFSDNHLSDSTRQTLYTYTSGTEYAIVKEIEPLYRDPATGVVICCVDLRTERPLDIVTSITWAFELAGTYTYWMPGLSKDTGDRNEVTSVTPFYREAPSTPGEAYKAFEHFRYCQGGFSGVYNGMFDRSIWNPDETKPNTLEHTLGGLAVVTGAVTGTDMTAPYTLGGLLSLLNVCCDAWTSSYSAVEDAANFVDVDGVRLKTPTFFDIKTLVASDVAEGGYPLQVCVKVGSWVAVNGLKYAWHTYKIVEAGGQGRAILPGAAELRARGRGCGNLYRQPMGTTPEAWTFLQALASDGHGFWRSASHEVYNLADPAVMWEYQTNLDAMGRWATREWCQADALALVARSLAMIGHPVTQAIFVTDCGILAGSTGHHRIENKAAGLTWTERFDLTDDDDVVWANIVLAGPRMEMVQGRTGGVQLQLAASGSGDWNAKRLATADYSSPYGTEGIGRIYVVAEAADNNAYFVTVPADPVPTVTVTPTLIGPVDGSAGALALIVSNRMLCAAIESGGSIKLYLSMDQGATWTYKQQALIQSYPYLHDDGNGVLWLVGYRTGAYLGASGKLVAQRYDCRQEALPTIGGEVTIGAADEGRGALIVRPGTWEHIAVACKAQTWTAPGTYPAIAEYRSVDRGNTWTFEAFHTVT
jgi:hypothetical protein